ncbi:DUF3892 domain-containing protein [Algoriphagus sp. D3-2-R+10]|uniref:DUF3892 domain-containing protein n=1 Tax=Algoriphagus aurantiacus TaxID=3103948 RepID=UPI002B37DD8E|nr:DUF3892 domain-containing protein [Algoriphagus sp. D3-2-R+10]MEB2778543.1 DUF3892 domain-containing protein [Algoriphagus sp. D3-2-R+10]
MRKLTVHFIQKDTKSKDSIQILKIGGVNNTGQRWAISTKEAIEGIESGQWELFVLSNNNEIPVRIRRGENQTPVLIALGDGYLHNLLEDLPEINQKEIL